MCIAYHASYSTYFLHLLCISRSLTKLLYFVQQAVSPLLREEVSALKDNTANLTALMESLVAAQNQPPSVQTQQTRVTTEAPIVPMSATPAVVQNRMPQGCPRGMSENFAPEGFNLGP